MAGGASVLGVLALVLKSAAVGLVLSNLSFHCAPSSPPPQHCSFPHGAQCGPRSGTEAGGRACLEGEAGWVSASPARGLAAAKSLWERWGWQVWSK